MNQNVIASPGITALSVGIILALLVSVLTASCSNVPDNPALTPTVRGDEVQIQMRLSDAGPGLQDEANKTASDLMRQRPRGLDGPLHLLSGPIPSRPPLGVQVSVKFAIDPQGNVVNSQLLRVTAVAGGAPSASLGVETLRVLAQWRFLPPMQRGNPVKYCCIQLTID